jgi:sec-independent protein translocase protein TatA
VPNVGPAELILILAIVVILFGAAKLPQLGKGIGEAIRNFKSAMRDGDSGASKKDDPPKQG